MSVLAGYPAVHPDMSAQHCSRNPPPLGEHTHPRFPLLPSSTSRVTNTTQLPPSPWPHHAGSDRSRLRSAQFPVTLPTAPAGSRSVLQGHLPRGEPGAASNPSHIVFACEMTVTRRVNMDLFTGHISSARLPFGEASFLRTGGEHGTRPWVDLPEEAGSLTCEELTQRQK